MYVNVCVIHSDVVNPQRPSPHGSSLSPQAVSSSVAKIQH